MFIIITKNLPNSEQKWWFLAQNSGFLGVDSV